MGTHTAGGEEKTPVCKACLLCEMINANSNWIGSKWNTEGQISPWCSTSNPKADDLISLNLRQEWTWPPVLHGIQQYSQETWNTSQASKQGGSACGWCSSACVEFSVLEHCHPWQLFLVIIYPMLFIAMMVIYLFLYEKVAEVVQKCEEQICN